MEFYNEMTVSFKSLSINESFARVVVASFVTSLDPTLEDLADIKTAVSEAVTNAIIHGYEGKDGIITIHCTITGKTVTIKIIDKGVGIEDIERLGSLLYLKPEMERSGMDSPSWKPSWTVWKWNPARRRHYGYLDKNHRISPLFLPLFPFFKSGNFTWSMYISLEEGKNKH